MAEGISPETSPLTYEETPVIEPVVTSPVAPTPPSVSQVPPSPIPQPIPTAPATPPPLPQTIPPERRTSPLLLLIIFAGLFVLGVWLSSYVRQFLPTPVSERPLVTATPTPVISLPKDPYENWKTYSVISGATRQAIPGIEYKLPPETAEPFCDGAGCASQGTTLPGATRFTVAARGRGQSLSDYRGKIITDATGRPFITVPTTVSDRAGVIFAGDFVGSTITGFRFSQMRGVMISVTDTLSLEVNHFTPTGVTTDFAADDIVFNQIIASFRFTGLPIPLSPIVPAATSAATSSATK